MVKIVVISTGCDESEAFDCDWIDDVERDLAALEPMGR